jgi:cation:H+ antiporter
MSRTPGHSSPSEIPFVRYWATMAIAAAAALPALTLRLLDITDAADPHLGSVGESLIFGLAIMAAATLLTWASEVAETELSATLALVILALIAVLPEYAVDLYFAWTAPTNPDNAQLAIANMTGANRLLVGLAWPVIFLIYWYKTRQRPMYVERSNALGIIFLGAATLYSFSIPIRSHLSLIDTAVMFSIFGAYIYISSRMPRRVVDEFVGPAAVIGALPQLPRRLTIVAMFLFAAAVIFASAAPFAEGLVHTGEKVGIDEFILVQWLAPLASESPEFILAGLLAWRGRHGAAMTILISSKVNQWTLLIGSLPLAYSISGGTTAPLDFDARQAEEVFLTASQSLFAVAIFISLSMSRWEALALLVLFATQLFLLDTTVRLGYASFYLLLSIFVLIRDIPDMPPLWKAAKETALTPALRSSPTERSPPGL